ncbi:MAG: 2'-5' RNA ligase family protein [Patescibacteria group bacterium]|nr:2'-5' RNA ligase family protein [Patescibacteria group bacterium]
MNPEFTTYLLALEVAPMTVGQAYEQLPMHCTVMHRFHSVLTPTELVAALQPIFSATAPIELLPAEHVAFGPKKQLVTLVEQTPHLLALHAELFAALNKLGVQYTEADWVGDGYVPHVTDKQGKRLPARSSTLSSAAYLISVQHPLQGHARFIEHKFELL